MGASNSSSQASKTGSSQQTQASEEPSSSTISLDDTLLSTNETVSKISQAVNVGGDAPVHRALNLWAPFVSQELIKFNVDQCTYISDSAITKLESKRPQKKKCGCTCCGRKKAMKSMTESDDGYSEYGSSTQVFELQSAQDMVVSPTEAFPLTMLSWLDMTPSEVGEKRKKTRRTQVPEKPDKPMSLWGLLKSAIGKDLSKFPLPVNFGEPLSMLQRLTEDYEYSSILDKASKLTDSIEQMASVAAFTVSSYATCAIRTAKPFNPLLGETFEFDRTDDLGWRCIAEQVCHHPPIACLHCESAMGWVHWQQFTMKSNFRATYLEVHPLGVAHLRFKTSDNHYTWRKVTTIIRNLYMGKLYIEQEGEMDIINHTTNEKCQLKYTCGGMFSRDRTVVGKIYNRTNDPKWEIKGVWDHEITATKLDSNGKPYGEPRIIWQKNSLSPDAENHYNFSTFACELNEVEDGVAPTDSRLRTDQRFMENALWDEANLEKQRLEEKQRQARKLRITEGAVNYSTSSNLHVKSVRSNTTPTGTGDGVEPYYSPCWFTRQRDPITGQYIYMYNGDYWPCKEKKNWSRCPRIYDK